LRDPLRSAGPQPLEVVKTALLRRKHVHDHAPCVKQDPASVGVTFETRAAETGAFERFRNRIRDRARLDLRAPGHDQKCVGEDRLADQVDCLKVLPFFVERGLARDLKQICQ
jgi:hypothetical protein